MPPLWLVALIVAAVAPFCAAALQAVLESRLRRRTQATLERAFSTLDGERSGEAPQPREEVEEERSGDGSRGEEAVEP